MAGEIQDIFGLGVGPELMGLFVGVLIFFIVLFIAIYIYVAFAYMKVAKKMRHPKPWLAWIPFANIAMWFQMGGFDWKLVFLMVLPFFISPIAGISFAAIPYMVFLIISHWRVFEKLGYAPWLSLSVALWIIPYVNIIGYVSYLIIIGIVAWKK